MITRKQRFPRNSKQPNVPLTDEQKAYWDKMYQPPSAPTLQPPTGETK